MCPPFIKLIYHATEIHLFHKIQLETEEIQTVNSITEIQSID